MVSLPVNPQFQQEPWEPGQQMSNLRRPKSRAERHCWPARSQRRKTLNDLANRSVGDRARFSAKGE